MKTAIIILTVVVLINTAMVWRCMFHIGGLRAMTFALWDKAMGKPETGYHIEIIKNGEDDDED